jgi:hypothetical protein
MNEFARPGLAEEKLPPVSTADNDKVLTVDGGVWKAKAPSGGGAGGGVLVVHYDENGVLDKTWQEIHDAVVAGQFIVIQSENDDGIFWNYISSVESSSDYYSVFVFWPGPLSTSELSTDSPTGYPAR